MNVHFRRFFASCLFMIFIIELYLIFRNGSILTFKSSSDVIEIINSYEEFEKREAKYKETRKKENMIKFEYDKVKKNRFDAYDTNKQNFIHQSNDINDEKPLMKTVLKNQQKLHVNENLYTVSKKSLEKAKNELLVTTKSGLTFYKDADISSKQRNDVQDFNIKRETPSTTQTTTSSTTSVSTPTTKTTQTTTPTTTPPTTTVPAPEAKITTTTSSPLPTPTTLKTSQPTNMTQQPTVYTTESKKLSASSNSPVVKQTGTEITNISSSFVSSNVTLQVKTKLNNQGKVNVYHYEDTCAYHDNYNLYWNVLFPLFPSKSELLTSLEDLDFFDEQPSISRRITGYITPKETEQYTFKLYCRLVCEFILKEPSLSVTNSNIILRFGIRNKFVKEKINSIPVDQLFELTSNSTIALQKDKSYLFDITTSYRAKGMFKLHWKNSKESEFHSVSSDLLSPLDPSVSITPPNTGITYRNKATNEKHLENDPRNFFYEMPKLDSIPLEECLYTNKSWMPDHVPDGYGTVFVQTDLIYPEDFMIDNFDQLKGGYVKYLTKNKADQIVKNYMKRLPGNVTLKRIVFLEENKEDKQGKRYFIELDIIDQNNIERRVSQWIFIKKNGVMCQPKGYTWNSQQKIYLLTPVKNQQKWIRYLVKSINDISIATHDKQLHLILIDYNSTDGDVAAILKDLVVPYTYIYQHGKFNKVKGLNLAVNSIKEEDGLIFVLDLQLQLPLFLFDYIRKHTFKRDTTYVPILLRCGCGQHPAYTKQVEYSIWQEIGYGMISMYKSDWLRIGGMNETRFSEKWGGEDWDLIEQLIIHKMEVMHHRLPGYYHLYHSTKGTWDGTKLI